MDPSVHQNQVNRAERRWIPRYLTVGPVSVPYVTRDKAIETIRRSFVDRKQICVAFCNSNTMLHAFRSDAYARILSRFLLLNDGLALDLCSWLFEGAPFQQNLNGTDFIPELLAASGAGVSVYLLGATQAVVAESGRRLAAQFPNCRIVGSHHGYFEPNDVDFVISDINAVSPDILLVGQGNPLQEKFIAQYARRIDARVLIGVGAFLDFAAGRVPRAPKLVRRLRLEWLFRFANEPRRLGRRYTIDQIVFFALVLRCRMSSSGRDDAGAGRSRALMRLRPE
jgi:beta-1,4-glucosyltransferase